MFAALGLASLALYGPSLGNGFVFDDHQIIVNNPRIRDWPADQGIFTSNYWFETQGRAKTSPNNYYRPVTLLSFAIDYKLWGANPAGFHLTNIVLFGLLLVVLFLLAETSLTDTGMALLAALLFGANPMHGEVVSFVGGRTDLLAALMAAASLHQYWAWRQGGKKAKLAASLAFWLLALGSKESAAAVPFLMAAMELTLGERGLRFWRKEHLLYLAVPAVYAAARYLALSGNTPWQGDSLDLSAIGTLPAKAWKYLKLSAFPAGLSTYYTERFSPGAAGMAGGLILASLPGAVALAPWARRHRAPLLATQIFIWGLLPSLGFIRNTSNVEFAERFAFLSSFGVALAVSWLILSMSRGRSRPLAAAIAVLAAAYALWMGANTFRRNSVWKNDQSLFTDMARTAPGSFLAHFNLANEKARRRDFYGAEKSYLRAIEIDGAQFDAYNNLGTLYFHLERWGSAESCYASAARLNGANQIIPYNAGLASLRQGKREAAADWFRRSLELDPGFQPARKALESAR